MTSGQDRLLKILASGVVLDSSGPTPGSAGNFPTFAGSDPLKNLEAALDAAAQIEVDGIKVGAVSILAREQGALDLIRHAVGHVAKNRLDLVIGAHDLRDGGPATTRPTVNSAYLAGARLLTLPFGIRAGYHAPEAIVVGGGITPTDWIEQWGDRQVNLVIIPGANKQLDVIKTYRPLAGTDIPFVMSGALVPPDARLDRAKVNAALLPYIQNGALAFLQGYPFRPRAMDQPAYEGTTSIAEVVEMGSVLVGAVADARRAVKLPNGSTLHEAILSATPESLARKLGASF